MPVRDGLRARHNPLNVVVEIVSDLSHLASDFVDVACRGGHTCSPLCASIFRY